MGFFQLCSVCSSPHHAAINGELRKRTPLKVIQQMFGIHKSSLSRHSRKCLERTRENKLQGRRVPIQLSKQWIFYDNTCPPEMQNTVPPEIRAADDYVVIRVSYEAPITDEFGRYLHPGYVMESALAENARRDAQREAEKLLDSPIPQTDPVN